ncbi:MAG: hypothetical protein QM539_04445 [Alphaproteobacteria bacterium]|nr:hypothetical protein [Alphaproteobacteria bacterium]
MKLKMNHFDALIHLVWNIAICDNASGSEKQITEDEFNYFYQIADYEEFELNWQHLLNQRNALNSDIEIIFKEAYKVLESSKKEWRLKCAIYMVRMAGISKEDSLESNISSKEALFLENILNLLKINHEELKNFNKIPPLPLNPIIQWQHSFVLLITCVFLHYKSKYKKQNFKFERNPFLKTIITQENLHINLEYFNQILLDLDYNEILIKEESCKTLKDCSVYWRSKCVHYMFECARIYCLPDFKIKTPPTNLIIDVQKKLNVTNQHLSFYTKKNDFYGAELDLNKFALIQLLYAVGVCDRQIKDIEGLTPDELNFLTQVALTENITISLDIVRKHRKKFKNNHFLIITDICEVLKNATEDWKLKCLNYIKAMAAISQEDDEDFMSNKEMLIILKTLKELGK